MAPRLPSRVARVAGLAIPDSGDAAQLGIVAPGTAGAAAVVAAAVDRCRDRGMDVIRLAGRRRERDDPFGAVRDLAPAVDAGDDVRSWRDALAARLAGGGTALVVEDAQWLDEASLRVVVGVAERAGDRGLRMVVTHRPVTGDADLAALDAVLGRSRLLVSLGPFDEAEVAETCAILLGSAVDERLVDAVHEQTQGMPDLVEVLVTAWAASGAIDKGRLAAPPPDPPPELVAALRPRIDELSLPTRTVLEALSAGADLDDDLLSATTDIAPDDLGDAIDDLGAAGLLVGAAGDVVPLVAAVVTAMTPVADRRRFHARLAAALRQRGAPATRTGEHLAAAGAQGTDAAAAFAAAGDATLVEAPELATEWYDRAIAAGAPAADLAARRAEAAALTGDAATALRLADGVMAAARAPDRERALAVVAALLPGRGLWRRSAAAYGELAGTAARASGSAAAAAHPGGAAWPLLAALGTIATGGPVPDLPAGAPSPGSGTGHADDPASGLEVEALRLTRERWWRRSPPTAVGPLPPCSRRPSCSSPRTRPWCCRPARTPSAPRWRSPSASSPPPSTC